MADNKLTETAKKIYVKPQVTEVRLVAGEAVLGVCKGAIGNQTLCVAQGNPSCISSSNAS